MNTITIPLSVKIKVKGKPREKSDMMGEFTIKSRTMPMFLTLFYASCMMFFISVKYLIKGKS